ncbi:hypothetical protein [Hydrogenivirga sp. 128-5-R1-1]|uniref:hypothetical protein n=1 Tax=Hydrogenivirga sp. 128-5-R1-1 TaxID=392423 RepID=UPI00015F192C|nr:hypothetical protein [Hydrogenivirga sp. 128-5-R1-1]EDP75529.1 hypothetical protein HG1285_16231 [Hydrogenivirga sp. 128-5-R1-1]
MVIAINEGRTLDILEHPDRERYPNQRLLIVEIGGYAYVVPFEVRKSVIRFITIFLSRKMTKKYLGGDRNGKT